MKKVAVILSGCGVFDGAEIHEAVISLLALARQGATVQCFAPDVPQLHVINHLTGEVSEGESRNVLVEAARICRGQIRNVAELDTADFDALLVPGGFGPRGIEGKINACRYARTHGVPYLGICLGMQIAIIEFARDVLGMADANSAEIDPSTTHPVIDILPEQKDVTDMGGTMRLGQYPCTLNPESKAYGLYGASMIYERHRHRYEVNNDYRPDLLNGGMIFAGTSPDNHIVEMVEIPDHPWFVAGQFHPEFKSRPNRPHPLFRGFVTAAAARMNSKK